MFNALKHEILVVDDDAAIRDSLALVLRSGGYEATTAVNGFDALLQLKRRVPAIVLSGGPIAIGVAALVGAGLGGAALKELFDDYTAAHHSEDFAAALKAGAVLLWVRCGDPDHELVATRILEEAGGGHVHVHGRSLGPEERTG